MGSGLGEELTHHEDGELEKEDYIEMDTSDNLEPHPLPLPGQSSNSNGSQPTPPGLGPGPGLGEEEEEQQEQDQQQSGEESKSKSPDLNHHPSRRNNQDDLLNPYSHHYQPEPSKKNSCNAK